MVIVGGDGPGRQINFLRETVRANGGPRQLTGSATTPKLLKMPPCSMFLCSSWWLSRSNWVLSWLCSVWSYR